MFIVIYKYLVKYFKNNLYLLNDILNFSYIKFIPLG